MLTAVFDRCNRLTSWRSAAKLSLAKELAVRAAQALQQASAPAAQDKPKGLKLELPAFPVISLSLRRRMAEVLTQAIWMKASQHEDTRM